MILLFDDNQHGQMSRNYKFDMLAELSKFQKIIKHIDKVTDEKALPNLIDQAKAVFIHKSFPPIDLKSRICYLAEQKGLVLVIFSGGEPSTIWDQKNSKIIRSVKKDRFYHALIPFLEFCKDNPDAEISVKRLIYGKKYEIERSKIIQDHLALFVASKKDSFNYKLDFSSGSQEYKYLIELFYFLHPENHEEKFSAFDAQMFENEVGAESFWGTIKGLISKTLLKYE